MEGLEQLPRRSCNSKALETCTLTGNIRAGRTLRKYALQGNYLLVLGGKETHRFMSCVAGYKCSNGKTRLPEVGTLSAN